MAKYQSPIELIPRELSQLAFNARVLQEARDESVPLLERLRFLAIFSSNQDEFYRVRVANLQRKVAERRGIRGETAATLLSEIQRRILRDQSSFLRTYHEVLDRLDDRGIRIVTERDLTGEQSRFVAEFFDRKVRPYLTPIILRGAERALSLDERNIYLGVRVVRKKHRRPIYAMVDVPTRSAPRFVRLPGDHDGTTIILLEDVIRHRLREVFSIFKVKSATGFVVKLTRDAGLTLEGNVKDSLMQRVEASVQRRRTSRLVRLVYDETMPDDLLTMVCRGLQVSDPRTLVPGGRHHNFKDFISFPRSDRSLLYGKWPSLGIPELDRSRSVMRAMRRRDFLIHTPYQRFSYIIDLLREAAIDPKVKRIRVTLYRVAKNSGIVRALINAVRNGKRVIAVVELTARFDESSNIEFADELSREGVSVVFGPPGLKIHSKMGLIERREHRKRSLYAFLGTGNLNEKTANVYADHFLLTTHRGICEDIRQLFRVIRRSYESRETTHLLVAPWSLRPRIRELIRAEIERAQAGEPALVEAKLNHLSDPEIVDLLREAVDAGVDVRLIVRGTFAIPADEFRAPNFRAISLLDRLLEHSRILVFGNGGDPLYFIASADWMPRNLSHRIEAACPVLDPAIQAELRQYLDLQWRDNRKARKHDSFGLNERVSGAGSGRVAQESIYRWLAERAAPASGDENGPADTRSAATASPSPSAA